MARILICGDRRWGEHDRDCPHPPTCTCRPDGFAAIQSERDAIKLFVAKLSPDTVVIHGAARGADRWAGRFAEQRGLTVLAFPADWNTHGKRAGPIRNSQMLKEGKPDRVVAFHANIEESKGTKDMRNKALKAGLVVTVHKA